MARAITAAERRYQDYLRQRGVRVSNTYTRLLVSYRRAELERVLRELARTTDPAMWEFAAGTYINEAGYLPGWYQGIITTAGLPQVSATAKALAGAAEAVTDAVQAGYFQQMLMDYATNRAGAEIVSVTGTMKEAVQKTIGKTIRENPDIGVEKLTKAIAEAYQPTNLWEARRIAQTEMMNGLAEADQQTADYLGIEHTKQWCISGVGNSRESHIAMDGVVVDADEPFQLDDCQMRFPHDTSTNPPAHQLINCACSCIRRPKDGAQPVTREDVTQQPAPEIDEREQRIQSIMSEMPADMPEATRRAIAENDLALEEKLGIKKGEPMDIEKADQQNANPQFWGTKQYKVNCATCCPTYALRERGFDVVAKGNTKRETSLNFQISKDPTQVWRNPDGTPISTSKLGDWMSTNFTNEMTETRWRRYIEESCKEPGTYNFMCSWAKGGNHVTTLKRMADGTIFRVEPQLYLPSRGTRISLEEFIADLSRWPSGRQMIYRVDDKILNLDWVELFSTKKTKIIPRPGTIG